MNKSEMINSFGGAFGFHARTCNDIPGGPITTLPRKCPKRGLAAKGGYKSEDYIEHRRGWRRKEPKVQRHVYGTPWPVPQAKINAESANPPLESAREARPAPSGCSTTEGNT